MSDQQQQTPAPPAYPGFQVTDASLAVLHQEVGRMLHESIEQAKKIAALSEQGRKIAQHNRLLLAAHGDGKCLPVVASDDERASDDDEEERDQEPMSLMARREEAG